MTDRIEKTIEVAAPVSKVWAAITDSARFCTWFRAELDGPFLPGKTVRGHSTYPGHEHSQFEILVQKMEPERLFSFTWPASADCQDESCHTLVEFTLEPTPTGTRVTVVESGFDKLPEAFRGRAFRDNSEGRGIQLNNVAEYVANAA